MTPDPENVNPENPEKKKAGRPKGTKNKKSLGGRPKDSGVALREQRRYDVSLQERIRQGAHPDLIFTWYQVICQGQTPVWVTDKDGYDYVIPDPNPLLPAPTLEQRNAAMKALADRGYGLPAQSVTIDAEFRNKIELQLTGISQQDLLAIDAQKLFQIAKVFEIKGQIEDAELVLDENTPLLESSNKGLDSNSGI